jgi:hypothetical protein
MTNKLSRRGFLTGGTAALAFGGIATGANAQTLAQKNNDTIRRLINFYDSTPGSDLTVYMFDVSRTTQKPRGVSRRNFQTQRSEVEFAINTVRDIRGGQFNRLDETEQFQRLLCLSRITTSQLHSRSTSPSVRNSDRAIFHGYYLEQHRLHNSLYYTAQSNNIPLRQCTDFLRAPRGLTIN